jgi:cellulose 1,4-beta-cellobiosidase
MFPIFRVVSMAHSTSFPWTLTVARRSFRPTRLALNTELVTVIQSVRAMSNLSMARYAKSIYFCITAFPHQFSCIKAKVVDWKPGFQIGYYGSCCSEIDIWEANSRAAAYTGHPCTIASQTRCEWDDCDYADLAGICDKDGCDFNSYRIGDQEFFGWGTTVDTSNKFTVITQFITHDNEC